MHAQILLAGRRLSNVQALMQETECTFSSSLRSLWERFLLCAVLPLMSLIHSFSWLRRLKSCCPFLNRSAFRPFSCLETAVSLPASTCAHQTMHEPTYLLRLHKQPADQQNNSPHFAWYIIAWHRFTNSHAKPSLQDKCTSSSNKGTADHAEQSVPQRCLAQHRKPKSSSACEGTS